MRSRKVWGCCLRVEGLKGFLHQFAEFNLLILDEATAALDYEAENLFQVNLKRIAVGRTVVMIAHRLSTVRNADTILVMDEGRLVEAGPHDDLIKRNGAYAALVKSSGLGG